MRGLAFCCPLLLVLGSADQLSLQNGIASLSEHLTQMSLVGKSRNSGLASGRKMMVESMLKTVSKQEKLTPAAERVLQNISDLLAQMLLDLAADQVVDQAQLDDAVAFASCEDAAAIETENNLESTAITSRQTHSACRAIEEGYFTSDAEACGAMTGYLGSLQPPDCDFPHDTASRANRDSYTTKLTNAASFFNNHEASYATLRDACTAADALLSAKIVECNLAHSAFETNQCEWRDHRKSRCDSQDACYQAKVSNHNTHVTDITANAARRMEDARMITYVKCLVDDLITGTGDFATWQLGCAAKKTANYDDYGNTFLDAPDKQVCNYVSSYPGTGDWEVTEYGSFNAVATPMPDTDYACST